MMNVSGVITHWFTIPFIIERRNYYRILEYMDYRAELSLQKEIALDNDLFKKVCSILNMEKKKNITIYNIR